MDDLDFEWAVEDQIRVAEESRHLRKGPPVDLREEDEDESDLP